MTGNFVRENMLSQLVSIIAAILVLVQAQSLPASITLSGFVRDMSALHPDFESPTGACKEQPGLFLANLTNLPDARPITTPPELRRWNELLDYINCNSPDTWAPSKTARANYGQFYFDEYYQDVPGVNIAIPVDLTLTLFDAGARTYQFVSSAFFPITGKGGFVREYLTNNNYHFCTEFRILFYYRGGEVFNFNGDDDLWVYIDNKLSSCDLGGIHPPRACSVNLDSIGLTRNRTYEMQIFHAERHFSGSSFTVTTSIVPVNRPPEVSNVTVTLNQDSNVAFQLSGFDPDYNSDLRFIVVSGPSNGRISVPVNKYFSNTLNTITYTPRAKFSGYDEISYLMTDNAANSTLGYIRINVLHVNQPPVGTSQEMTLTAGETKKLTLIASDPDNDPSQLRFLLISTPQFGYADLSLLGEFTYQSVNPGTEQLEWRVDDGIASASGFLTITIAAPPVKVRPTEIPTSQAGLQPQELTAIIAGGATLFVLIGMLIAYFLYFFVAANRFQKQWEKEFKDSRLVQNPLYVTAFAEHTNPLYDQEREAHMNAPKI